MNESMRERLIDLRKNHFNMSQREFAERFGMSQSTYAPLEVAREIRDAYVKLICQAYHVNEEWFRNGTLPMFTEERDKELDELLNVYDKLRPSLKGFMLRQARELRDLQNELDV